MNGRAYDYNLGRFLSVDPFIQAPGNSQSMNPYSYIMNNPLAGTDPSGYVASALGSLSALGPANEDHCAYRCVANQVLAGFTMAGGNGFKERKRAVALSNNSSGGAGVGKFIEQILSEHSKSSSMVVDKTNIISKPFRFAISGDAGSRNNTLEAGMDGIYEHMERMRELDEMVEASEQRISDAGDAAARSQNGERVKRRQREIDIERGQAAMRQKQAKPVLLHNFDNINRGHGEVVPIVVGITAIPFVGVGVIKAGPAVVSTVGTIAKNRKKIIRGCVLIASLCNNINDVIKQKKPGASSMSRRQQIEEKYRQGDALRRLNEHLKNVPTKVK